MDELDKILYKIKVYRTAEGFIDDLFLNMYIRYNPIKFIDRYYKDNNFLFEYNKINETITVSWTNVYYPLIKKYKCSDNYINCLIEQKIIEYFNIYGVDIDIELPF